MMDKPYSDDLVGMLCWWNLLTEQERRRWMREAGDTGIARDAWLAFKKSVARPVQ
jgi:hypothetical protein